MKIMMGRQPQKRNYAVPVKENTMQTYRWLLMLILLSVSIFFGCSTVQVGQDYDPAKTFSHLRTYDWQSKIQEKTGDPRVDNPLIDTRIRKAVDRSLMGKNYPKVSNGTPDFYVAYQFVIHRKIESDSLQSGVGFGFGSYGNFGGIGIGTGGDISEYDEGMLIIDIIDAKSGGLLWRGTGTRRVSLQSDPEKTTQNVNETVDKIMAQFPPIQKKPLP